RSWMCRRAASCWCGESLLGTRSCRWLSTSTTPSGGCCPPAGSLVDTPPGTGDDGVMLRPLLVTAFLSLLFGCATGGKGGGRDVFPGDDKHEAAARAQVERRAAFDLSCEDVSLVLLSDVTRLGQQMTS